MIDPIKLMIIYSLESARDQDNDKFLLLGDTVLLNSKQIMKLNHLIFRIKSTDNGDLSRRSSNFKCQ